MATEKFTKQIYEEFPIGGEFSANMTDGATIASHTVTARDKAGTDASSAVLGTHSNDGVSIVNVIVKGGTVALQPYIITFRCIDSDGYKWELDVKMAIKET